MSNQRLQGFVIGHDAIRDGKPVWKVRVRGDGPHKGRKLIVASVHEGIELAQGLNVNFVIGTVDDPSGTKQPRAVDVRLDT